MILVDNGSVVEVLFYDAFKKMGLDDTLLRPTGPIYGFTNQLIKVKGVITLFVTLNQKENTITKKVEFLVVDQPSTCNAIIGRPFMKKTNMVTTVYCLTIKFPSLIGIGYVKANQAITRQCQVQSLQLSGEAITRPNEVVVLDVLAIE